MPGRTPRCIVLAPTRELANQVEREFAASAPTLAVGCFYGGAGRGHLCLLLGWGAVMAASCGRAGPGHMR